MALVTAEEKYVLGKCIMCGGKLERGNAGNICNQCKDSLRVKK